MYLLTVIVRMVARKSEMISILLFGKFKLTLKKYSRTQTRLCGRVLLIVRPLPLTLHGIKYGPNIK